ncbi:hypothetical protein ASNO1_73860 [Corallococcus caeni]|uniref:Uncharacterized protein n=1 Tax=Corallococcus caeni TaxID=3082388 RepID=A0ABQ6R4J0_9BACT|nr:hypothetical protein ASNO1_73860 [Corallococcus sp. NO1]
MHRHQQQVLRVAQAHEGRAQERTGFQIEGPACFEVREAPRLFVPLRFRQRGHVEHGQRPRRGRVDALSGLPLVLDEGGAQRLVPGDEGLEGAAQGFDVHLALQAKGRGDVVRGAAGLELVQEPQPLLGEGERRGAFVGGASQRRQTGAGGGGAQTLGEGGDGGGLEEGAQGHFRAEGGADAGDELGGQQRVAAEGEEVGVDAHALHAQDVGEDFGELLFGGVARGNEVREGRGVRDRQGLPVHLAVGVEGQGVQHEEGGGHHVLGQPLLEEGSHRGGVQLLARGGHEVRHQTLVTRGVLTGEDDGLMHGGMGEEGGFDFAQLDAEATHLHLEVEALQVVQLAVGPPAHDVASAVEASARGGGEGVGDEALGTQGGLAEVAPGEALAGEEELTGDADGHRLQVGVEDVGAGVGDGAANGRARAVVARGGGDGGEGGDDGALGGAVVVEEGGGQRGRRAVVQGVSARQQGPEGHGARPLLTQHGLGQGRRHEAGGDGFTGHPLQQLRGLRAHGVRRDDEAGARGQRRPHLPGGGVEGDAGGEGSGVVRRQRIGALVPGDEIHQCAVVDGNALGHAGAAGGVDDVGQILWPHRSHRQRLSRCRCLQGEDSRGEDGEGRPQVMLGEEDGGSGVLQHESQTLRWDTRRDGDVGAADFEDSEQSRHQLRRALGEDGDAVATGDTGRVQLDGKAVGPGVEARVGDASLTHAHGDGVRCTAGLLGDDVVDAGVAREGDVRLIPFDEKLLPLRSRHEGQRGNARVGLGGEGGEEDSEVAHQTLDGGGVEEVGAVLEEAGEALGHLEEGEGQVEAGGVALQGDGLEGHARDAECLGGGILQDEHHLEERAAAQVA